MRRSPLRQPTPHKPGCATLRSEDGAIEFTLGRTPNGVVVERISMRGEAARVVQTVLFTDGDSFERWCDTDVTRFEHPMLYVNLKRDGGALFGRSIG
ncbi:MAG: hypothetical protein KIT60_14005 [Burkholderiaceae bacterium]|nr:hypothetical protein [Burkholderiaceae bacterium]